MKRLLLLGLLLSAGCFPEHGTAALLLEGTSVTPHLQSTELRYRREPDRSLGARVQLYLRNDGPGELRLAADTPIRLRDKTPEELLAADEWAWHDFPSAWTNAPLVLPPGALTVWSFNGKRAPWGTGTSADTFIGTDRITVPIETPDAWLSAVTFLGEPTNPFPTSLIFHVANQTKSPLRLEACRLWLPAGNDSWRALLPLPWQTNFAAFPSNSIIPARDRGGARVATGRLLLTYAALEVRCSAPGGAARTLWAHVRIKREVFDISGGWVASKLGASNALHSEPFLKTLRRMHVNAGMHDQVPGYTDNAALYEKYPLKYMNRCRPFERYDTEAVLPRVHAVEFLGEPQYGGGRPVPPMEVWRAFAPYQATRLPTSVTHSEERVWRFYAGLSDYPHYDAYRVCAPAPDSWGLYDRWNGERLRWGAPLETIGDMTRSLRELNRPASIAYWSQGAHAGWDSYGGRRRTSPTPEELRLQAYHALSSRITSLYWFNLSLKSLVKFPDLIQPITEVGREIRMLEDFYLEGDATHYQRLTREGKPDWDLSVVAGLRGAVLFALDLAYRPDSEAKVFQFSPPREVTLTFPLPAHLRQPAELLCVDANRVEAADFTKLASGIQIASRCGAVNVWVVSPHAGMAAQLEALRMRLLGFEESFAFNPASQAADLEQLRQLQPPTKPATSGQAGGLKK
jgi:hypothetical protein